MERDIKSTLERGVRVPCRERLEYLGEVVGVPWRGVGLQVKDRASGKRDDVAFMKALQGLCT